MTQTEKALQFRSLHEGSDVLLIPNPWDAGSARMMEHLDYPALATSSFACAATLGRRDGRISRDEAFTHARLIVEATRLPVSADLENGFNASPAGVAETIRQAAAIGLVGCSIEDASGDSHKPQYDISHATERIAAAAEAARALPFPFTLTARAENFFKGDGNLDDTIKRLAAYEEAGADVLFAPALPDLDAVRAVCATIRKPVNFMVGAKGRSFSVAELSAAGVKRISFAGSLYRLALTGLLGALREIKGAGTFHYLDASMTGAQINSYLRE